MASKVAIGVDPQQSLIDEWKRTADPEEIDALVIKWVDCGGLFTISKLGRVPPGVGKQLTQLGFRGTIDKLLVKIALELRHRIIVTEDSDFWNPHKKSSRGCESRSRSPVWSVLTSQLGVRPVTLSAMLKDMS